MVTNFKSRPSKRARIERLLAKGVSPEDIAKELRVGVSYVEKVHDDLKSAAGRGRPKGWRSKTTRSIEQRIKEGVDTLTLMEEFGYSREHINSRRRGLKRKRPQKRLKREGGLYGRTKQTLQIEQLIKDGVPPVEIAAQFRVTPSHIYQVRKRFKANGHLKTVKATRKAIDEAVGRRYTTMAKQTKLRKQAERMHAKGQSLIDIARKLSISVPTLRNYLKL